MLIHITKMHIISNCAIINHNYYKTNNKGHTYEKDFIEIIIL